MKSQTIRKTRMYSGITQVEMAKMLFMSETKYCRKENGRAKISRQEAVKMAKILELNENAILKYWMADHLYELMKDDKELVYEALKIVESNFDNFEECVKMPSKNNSYSTLEERLKRRKKK